MKNIMITGAAGFIGANFAEHMVKRYDMQAICIISII